MLKAYFSVYFSLLLSDNVVKSLYKVVITLTTGWSKELFAKNLRKYIEESGKTQTQVAKEIGIPRPTLMDWLAAKKYPRIDKIELLANYFGILKSNLIEEHSSSDMATPAEIGQIIKEARIKKGLSRKDLAEQAEISETSITKCENGDTIKIAPVKIKNIARILDLNPLELLGFKDLGKQPEKIIVSAADFSKDDFAQIKQFIEFIKNKNK